LPHVLAVAFVAGANRVSCWIALRHLYEPIVSLMRWEKGTTHFKGDLTPVKVERDQRKKKIVANDEAENEKVKARSKGQCEVVWFGKRSRRVQRCKKRAIHVHHMYGGFGVRGRGKSALAKHKQHVCADHHSEIGGTLGGKVLRRVGGDVPLWTDEYEDVRK